MLVRTTHWMMVRNHASSCLFRCVGCWSIEKHCGFLLSWKWVVQIHWAPTNHISVRQSSLRDRSSILDFIMLTCLFVSSCSCIFTLRSFSNSSFVLGGLLLIIGNGALQVSLVASVRIGGAGGDNRVRSVRRRGDRWGKCLLGLLSATLAPTLPCFKTASLHQLYLKNIFV